MCNVRRKSCTCGSLSGWRSRKSFAGAETDSNAGRIVPEQDEGDEEQQPRIERERWPKAKRTPDPARLGAGERVTRRVGHVVRVR